MKPLPLALLSLFFPFAPVAAAQRPVDATLLRAHVRIVDGVASTRLALTLTNDGAEPAEATWLLPLPPGSVADDFRMTIGGERVRGEVLDEREARGVYEGIVRARRDPGLLEHVGRGCLRARVFPIPARGTLEVEVGYREILPRTAGMCRWALEVGSAGLDAGAPEQVVLELELESRHALHNAFSPSAGLQVVALDDHRVRATYEGSAAPNGELALMYALAEQDFGLDLLSTRARGADEGTFLMLLSPRRELGEAVEAKREIVFALDTSGSMSGPKIEQARGALRLFLRSLAPQDRFGVVPFATEARPFFRTTVPADAKHVDEALARAERLRAEGGTNLADALRSALALDARAGEHVPLVVLLTDGLPSVEITDVQELLARAREWNRSKARIFVFGVGDDVNTLLLDTLADESGGARGYVREREDIELAAGDLFAAIAHPVLTDLELRVEGAELLRLVPKRLPDLFHGGRLVVAGRYRGTGPCTVRLSANHRGARREFEYRAELAADPVEGLDFVPSLWAERRVAFLLDEIRLRGGTTELADEVRALGVEHRIVTPYTSHLILEEGLDLPRPGAGGSASGPATPGPSGPGTPGPSTPGSRGAQEERGAPRRAPARDTAHELARVTRRLVEAGVLPQDAPAAQTQELALALVKELRAADRALAGLGGRTSGAAAVDDSVYLARLVGASAGSVSGSEAFFGGARAPQTDLLSLFTRKVKDKAFVLRAGVWTDRTAIDAALPRTRVEAFSDEWFALLAAEPELAPYFAFSTRLVVVLDGRVYEVRAPAQAPAGR